MQDSEELLETEINDDESPGIESREDIFNVIQSLAFASPEPLSLKKIRSLMGDFIDANMLRECVRICNENLNSINSPFELVEQAGGLRFRTRQKYYPWVRKLFPEGLARRLSQAALETLSIIAYKQPVTKAELENIRGVASDGPLKSLLDKKLISLGPRSETVGNAFTYVTTADFMKYFGINRIPEDLPRLSDLEDLMETNALVPQFRQGSFVTEDQDDSDPNQFEMPMGDD
jgi:segregation and condensation protein B